MPTPLPIVARKELKKNVEFDILRFFLKTTELVGCLGNGQLWFLMLFSNGACAKAY
jgi:hypothetical protein